MTRATVIVNPAAGRGLAARAWHRASAALPAAADAGCVQTEYAGHARTLAREAASRGDERVIAVGGDGTVSEVADGLVGSDAVLGIVPAGSGNDFSRALGLPRSAAQAARIALTGAVRRVDVGRLQTGRRRVAFVNVAGCGFDAEVVRRTTSRPHVPGTLLYLLGVLRTLAQFRALPLRFVADGHAFERRVLGVAVANGPRYGGGMPIAPRAVIDDGVFDVCVIADLSPAQLLALLPRLYTATHTSHPAVELFRCRELTVEPLSEVVASCQADGELLDPLPATFSIQPGGLRCAAGPVP